ncbi:preprotein translocase subunit YajC [Arthrobacter woluwensis]|uniref:preprotein translocase subunit YajC n=1 Tax=Arthrobacter woluwensis TaxID=156980 RepID=UPI000D118A62|nr:preprotein translocase subunit YajC [Arthrobacter woluwensis]PSS45110.1 preprotein translocase subunit YajC [Arthrobacter woluwensis]
MLAALAVLMFFMMRRNKKVQQQQQQMQSKFAPGVDVMTSFGLFGTIRSIDEAENKVVLELSPGHLATVHRQAIAKVVEPVTAEPAAEPAAPAEETVTEAQTAPAAELPETVKDDVAPGTASETPEETLKRLNGDSK